MPYCPQCLTEYVEGVSLCEDCQTALVPGDPPPAPHFDDLDDGRDVKMVTARTFRGPTALLDADLARNLLQEQGIPCILPGETSVEILPVLEISLLVREEDAARAARVLSIYFDSPGPILVE